MGVNDEISAVLKSFKSLVMMCLQFAFKALKYCKPSSKSEKFEVKLFSIIISSRETISDIILNFHIFSFAITNPNSFPKK